MKRYLLYSPTFAHMPILHTVHGDILCDGVACNFPSEFLLEFACQLHEVLSALECDCVFDMLIDPFVIFNTNRKKVHTPFKKLFTSIITRYICLIRIQTKYYK